MRRFNDEDDLAGEARVNRPVDPMQAIEMLGRRLGGAILVGSALIAFGLYAGGDESEPKFQAFATDGEVFRVNTESGTILACNGERCRRVLQRGQDLADDDDGSLFKFRITRQEEPPPAAPADAPAAQQPQLPAPQQR